MIRNFFKRNLPKSFLSEDETQKLEKRVGLFEEKTGCELVFHFRRKLGSNPTAFNQELFRKFGLDKTTGHRGILITLALTEKKFAVWADEGVAIHTGDKLWLKLCESLSGDLKHGHHLKALMNCVELAEEMLKGLSPHEHFKNELSNKPIIEDE